MSSEEIKRLETIMFPYNEDLDKVTKVCEFLIEFLGKDRVSNIRDDYASMGIQVYCTKDDYTPLWARVYCTKDEMEQIVTKLGLYKINI